MDDRNIFFNQQDHEGQVLVTIIFCLKYEVTEQPMFEDGQRPLGISITFPHNRKWSFGNVLKGLWV